MLSVTERMVLYAALLLATAAAWLVSWLQASGLPAFSPYLTQIWCGDSWTAASSAASFTMWMSMMVAMMLPTAAPMIEAFASIARRRRARRDPYSPTLVFVAGYLVAWTAFSAAAVMVQWQLYRAALLTPNMQNASPLLAGATLLVAGLYQFTPLKRACLRRCRTPMSFIVSEWREGVSGALSMGVRHGLTCIGCCWAVMALMFCVSVMDLRWAAALAVYAAAEKLLPGGATVIAPASGAAAVFGGLALIGVHLL
jgi:predicted metal-binding membrane protein